MARGRSSKWWLLMLAVVVAPGCGKGLLPGTAYDQSLLHFSGNIVPSDALANAKHPRLGIVWTDPMQRQADIAMSGPSIAWTHVRRSSGVGSELDRYTGDLYRPPPAAALVDVAAPPGDDGIPDSALLAVGELVVFDDIDQDQAFSVSGPRAEIQGDDIYLAGSDNLIVYVAKPFARTPPQDFPLGTSATATGYTMLYILCVGRVFRGAPPGIPDGTSLMYQRTMTIPEVRLCMSTHSS